MTKLHNNKINRKKIALCDEIKPVAIGRSDVLNTFISKFRSNKSLTTQPAPRISKAPIPKSIKKLMSGILAGFAKLKDHQPGKSNNQVPIGRSTLAKRI